MKLEVIIFICGIIVGGIAISIITRQLNSGTVEIDMSDPDVPYLRLNLDGDDLDNLHKKKYVTFKVDSKANFTREKQVL